MAGDFHKTRDYINHLLRLNPWMEYTYCPHCTRKGIQQIMDYDRAMSFGNLALFQCPRCQTTLDKPIQKAIPSKIGITPKGPSFYFRR